MFHHLDNDEKVKKNTLIFMMLSFFSRFFCLLLLLSIVFFSSHSSASPYSVAYAVARKKKDEQKKFVDNERKKMPDILFSFSFGDCFKGVACDGTICWFLQKNGKVTFVVSKYIKVTLGSTSMGKNKITEYSE